MPRRFSSRGQGLVEFAAIFPLFVVLIFGMIDGGLVMGRYNNINNSAKEAARLGAVGVDETLIVQRAQDQAHGQLDSASTSCADWSTQPRVICVEWIPGPNGEAPGNAGSSVRVKIKYHNPFLTPILNWTAGSTWDVKVCAVQRLEISISPVPNTGTGDSC